jgi:hypothetical protein
MPLSDNTSGPLEPSPGNGPPVSSGTASRFELDAAAVVAEVAGVVLAAVVPDVPEVAAVVPFVAAVVGLAAADVDDALPSDAQLAATTARPAPANIVNSRRLAINVPRSKLRPRSWSCSSSFMIRSP